MHPDIDSQEYARVGNPVELRVEGLVCDANGTRGTSQDPGDLVVFPAQAVIQPGQSQVFRVQYVGDAELDKSRHYYVTVAQLPVQFPQGETGIQVLYNIQVVASVQPRDGTRSEEHKSELQSLMRITYAVF